MSELYRDLGLSVLPPRAADAGKSFSDAELECEHGRLPGDRTPPCGCWESETMEPNNGSLAGNEPFQDGCSMIRATLSSWLGRCTFVSTTHRKPRSASSAVAR